MQDIPEELTALLGSLREQRLRMDAAIAENPKTAHKFNKSLGELANALRALSSEARQWAGQVASTMAVATAEQKTDVALAWLTSLPVGARTAAYKQLIELEAKSFERLPISYGS